MSCLITRQAEFTFGSPHFLYAYYKEPGKLRETADFIAAEFSAFSRLADGCGTGCDYVARGLETGDWQSAELNAFKALYKAKAMAQTGIIICASLTLIRYDIYQGKIDEALEHLQQLRADVTKENNAVYNSTLELVTGYIYGCLGQMDGIPAWLRTGDMNPAYFMYQGMAFNYIVHGKAVLLSKNAIRLEILVEDCQRYYAIFTIGLVSCTIRFSMQRPNTGCMGWRKAAMPCKKLLIWQGKII